MNTPQRSNSNTKGTGSKLQLSQSPTALDVSSEGEINPQQLIQTIIRLKDSRKGYTDKLDQLENMFESLMKIKDNYNHLQLSHSTLEQQCQALEKLLNERQNLGQDIVKDIRQHLQEDFIQQIKRELIQTILEELKQTLLQEIKNELINELKQELQKELNTALTEKVTQFPQLPQRDDDEELPALQPLSYASKASSVPPKKPTLIIKSKQPHTKPSEIKSKLHILSKEDIGLTNCYGTPGGRVVVQCLDNTRKELLKNLISNNEELKDNLEITEPEPRNVKVMIFGAPKAPKTKVKIDKEEIHELDNYLQDLVIPSIAKATKKPKDEVQLTPILNIQAGSDRSHLVLQLPEDDARLLLHKGKIFLGFNSCSIQRYISVIRCYKCQRFDHMARNCKFEHVCAVCGGNHPTGGGPDGSPPCSKRPRCINCLAIIEEERDKKRAKCKNQYRLRP